MKKALITILILMTLIISIPVTGSGQTQGSDYQVIPDEAIRLRILANSNSETDQQLKRVIRDNVNAEITTWVESLTSIETAREMISNRLGEVEDIVATTLEGAGVSQSYQVAYDQNVSFPTKLYGNYIYPAGQYEAILITLGQGKGDNWWCVLFPPLCFLDFSNGTTVAAAETGDEAPAEAEEVEVEFFLVKLWNKLISLFS
ncbi:stage II sporulation protein R [Thalassobacillus hwangdonensis]|uniref:Stage II sporulation protein R n=1 Tax=Thalassobacillus hwangdonensis TaxID=546108 RepID=A0ABW3L1Z0_9BACI